MAPIGSRCKKRLRYSLMSASQGSGALASEASRRRDSKASLRATALTGFPAQSLSLASESLVLDALRLDVPGSALRRVLSPTFPAGELAFFIPWRVVAENPARRS